MKKFVLSFLFAGIALFFTCMESAIADGKILLQLLPSKDMPESIVQEQDVCVSFAWNETTNLPQTDETNIQPQQPRTEKIVKGAVQNLTVGPEGTIEVKLPELQPYDVNDTATVFLRGNYRGVIAWNGKTDAGGEEIMIVDAAEKSVTEYDDAVLSIIPLPDKPISIKRSEECFDTLSQTVKEKLVEAGAYQGQVSPIVDREYPRIASYHIFVMKIDNMETLVSDVKDYLFNVYSRDVHVNVSTEEMQILQSYWDKGYKYFALDISVLSGRTIKKSPIMFHFASPQIYFPLQIGSVGGKGSTLVSLLILSPDKIKLTGAIKDKDVILVGNRTVTIEVPAIEAIHPTLADFFKKNGCEKVLARYFLISGETAGFAGDFCATVSD